MAISSPVGICKMATVGVGFFVLIIGCVSHFQSSWTKKVCVGSSCAAPYEVCNLITTLKCPAIDMERYYVAMIIICFFLSLAGLVAMFYKDTSSSKLFDMGYHGISAILLFIAAIVYLVSAEQIGKIFYNKGPGFNYRRPEKLAAGSLTILQAFLYGVTALFIART